MGKRVSKRRDVLDSFVSDLRSNHPGCAILLTGSLRDGRERSNSDVNLLVVGADVDSAPPPGARIVHRAPGIKVVEMVIDEVPVTVVCVSPSILSDMAREPWRNYQFGQARVLHDPDGLATGCQRSINAWFAEHPDVAELWHQQQAEHARVKAAKRDEDRDIPLAFPTWEGFADHVDRIVRHNLPRSERP